ncbi:MAG TPA: MFS transporter [Candidatus Limnocylindria bacterium]|nr:MFS transporter [Candidatus Limnocylindria bacterium]
MRRNGVALVTAEAVGFGFTYSDQAALIPLLAAELGINDVQAGLLSTALFLAYMCATLLTSGLPDRFGPKPVIAAGLGGAAIGAALLASATSFELLLVAKAVQGVGSALAFIASARFVAGLYGDEPAHFSLGLYGGGFPLGSALALLVSGTVATALGGWRWSFALEACALAAMLVAWLALAPAVSGVRREGSMLDALGCANCWLVSLQHAAGFGMAIAAGSWITVYLLREFALPLTLSGVLGSLLLLLAFLTRPLGGLFVTRGLLRTKAVMRAGDLAVIGGIALLALPGRPLPIALAGAVVLGFGVGLPYSAVFNTAAASLPTAPGAAQGLAAIGGTAGVMVGAPAMGYAVQTWGFGAAWGFVGLVGALAFLGTLLMRGEEELGSGYA